MRVATSETKAAWTMFFADLVARGLTGVLMVTSDAHPGLVLAISANLPGTTWLRCRTHYAANLMSATPKGNLAVLGRGPLTDRWHAPPRLTASRHDTRGGNRPRVR